jgi:hypothetical protein
VSLLARRFVLTSVVAAAATICLFVVGWTVALPGLAWFASLVGIDRLVFTAPTDLLLVRLKLGATLALAPVVAWAAVLIHRVRRGVDASTAATLLYFAVPVVAVVGGVALRALWIWAAMRDVAAAGVGGVRPMITLSSLSPHSWGVSLGLAAGVLLCLAVGARDAKR